MAAAGDAEAPSEELSLYERLGVPKDASREQIRKAYFKLSLRHHPDKGGDAETFKALTIAYTVLHDEDRRREYDESGEVGDDADSFGDGGDDRVWVDYWKAQFQRVTVDKIREFAKTYQGSEEERQDILNAYREFDGDLQSIMEVIMCCDELVDEERFSTLIETAIAANEIPPLGDFSAPDGAAVAKDDAVEAEEEEEEDEGDEHEEEDEDEEEEEDEEEGVGSAKKGKKTKKAGKGVGARMSSKGTTKGAAKGGGARAAATTKRSRLGERLRAEREAEAEEAMELARELGLTEIVGGGGGGDDDAEDGSMKALERAILSRRQKSFDATIAALEAKYAQPAKKKARAKTGGSKSKPETAKTGAKKTTARSAAGTERSRATSKARVVDDDEEEEDEEAEEEGARDRRGVDEAAADEAEEEGEENARGARAGKAARASTAKKGGKTRL